jgi:hypothetical protein
MRTNNGRPIDLVIGFLRFDQGRRVVIPAMVTLRGLCAVEYRSNFNQGFGLISGHLSVAACTAVWTERRELVKNR